MFLKCVLDLIKVATTRRAAFSVCVLILMVSNTKEASERGYECWVVDVVYKSREGSYYEVGKENSSSVFVNVDLNNFRHVR